MLLKGLQSYEKYKETDRKWVNESYKINLFKKSNRGYGLYQQRHLSKIEPLCYSLIIFATNSPCFTK